MLKAGARTNRSLAAPEGRRASTTSCSSQQAAAAWAWFEHGGMSTCITPAKAEGLMAAKRSAKCNFAGPSRFRKELLSSTAIPQQSAGRRSIGDDIAKGHAHSFHDDDLAKCTSYKGRFSRSCRRSPHFNKDEGPDQDEAEDEEGREFQVDDEASSLLDKFEVHAVCRQLHNHLSSTFCSPSSTCSAELQENVYEAQKAHHHPQAHIIKPRGYFKSSNSHKPLADTEHHQNINDVVQRLLRLRITSSRFTSSITPAPAGAPRFCRSIATADSIVNHRHHHPASPKQLIRAGLPLNQTSKRFHDLSQNTGRVSNDSGDLKRKYLLETADAGSGVAGQHERGELASSHRTSEQKMWGRSELEQLVGGAPPSRLHYSDLLCSKEPMSRLPDMSALLGHINMDEAPSMDDGVAFTNRHRHFHKHHHIHHHHHHHHLQQYINQASQDTVLLDNLIAKNDLLQYPPRLTASRRRRS